MGKDPPAWFRFIMERAEEAEELDVASPRDIVRIVLRRSARELVWGVGIGLAIAIVISQAFAATMENVPAGGPEVFLAIVATVITGAVIALWRPVRRAVRLSAVDALKH